MAMQEEQSGFLLLHYDFAVVWNDFVVLDCGFVEMEDGFALL